MSKHEYVTLVKCREADLAKHQHFYDAFIQLKDYNTSLRMAIANIPSTNKGNNQQAIKKAKRLANKEPAPLLPVTPKPKRSYTRRKQTQLPSRRRMMDSSSLDHSESSESSTNTSSSLDTITTISSSSSSSGDGDNNHSSSISENDDDNALHNNSISVGESFAC